MARAGINKAVVSAARQAVIARGENPTIDAVRIEMGNTGSKTTIHRYLKELEARNPAAMTPARSLSDELSSLVTHIAERLKEEGEAHIEEAKSAFDEALATTQAALAATQQQLAQLEQSHLVQSQALQAQTAELLACQATLQGEQTRSARLDQACTEQQMRLKDKDEHIASLEEKHRHARDALEHYRQSVKEQREQEQRRHEAQLQVLQVETRQLQQTLQVRQQEATLLNRDNERLLVENRQAATTQIQLQEQINRQAEQAITSAQAMAKLDGSRDELLRQLVDLRSRLDEALTREHGHRLSIDQLSGHNTRLQHERDAALDALAVQAAGLEVETSKEK